METTPQPFIQRAVMLKPPKRRPAEDDESRLGPPQPFQFRGCGPLVRRRPPVHPIALGKWNRPTTGQDLPRLPLAVVYQDKALPEWDQGVQLRRYAREPVPP